MNKLLRKIKYVLLPMLTIVLLCTGEAKAKDYSCSIQIPVTTEVSNNAPAGTDFHIVMEPIGEDVPMPEVSDIVLTDNANYSFGPITYVTPEDYQYRIYQEKGNAKNFTYDDTVYTVTVRVVNAEDGGLKAVIWAVRNDEEQKVEEIIFKNEYTPPEDKVQTGDNSNMSIWGIILLISILCIALIMHSKKRTMFFSLFVMAFLLMSSANTLDAQAASDAKIHYLTLPDNTLAVLVECNGHFGMIDSGEDSDYPNGSDSRYPLRAHITTNAGYENTVIAYLKSVGVTTENFDFYIGTHAHSDHIGSADEVIKAFKPKTVYTPEYKDSYVSNSAALWDNLYVYDCMISAANEVGATIVQNFNSSNTKFTLGDGMEIQLLNYSSDYKTSPKPDANYFSLGVLVKANGKSAFVAGDINNYEGDETALISQLGHVDILTLGHHGYTGSNSYAYVTGVTPKMMILPGTYSAVSSAAIDDSDKALIDTLIEMGNAGVPLYATGWYSNDQGALVINFDSSLSNNIPQDSRIAHTANVSPELYVHYKNGIPTVYNGTIGGVTFDNSAFYSAGTWHQNSSGQWYFTNASGIKLTGWQHIRGVWYYFYSNGIMAANTWVDGKYYVNSDGAWIRDYVAQNEWIQDSVGWWYKHADGSYTTSNWELIDGKWYYFNAQGYRTEGWQYIKNVWYYLQPSTGIMLTGWQNVNGSWYYMNSDGAMLAGWQTIGGAKYYLGSDGARRTGWQTIGSSTYYFDSNGKMAANTWVDGKYLNASGVYVPNQWIKQSGKWWYRHGDGSYTTSNWELIDGKWYYFDASGWMLTGWLNLNRTWYYLNSDGSKATSCWVDGGQYYVDANGVWVQ